MSNYTYAYWTNGVFSLREYNATTPLKPSERYVTFDDIGQIDHAIKELYILRHQFKLKASDMIEKKLNQLQERINAMHESIKHEEPTPTAPDKPNYVHNSELSPRAKQYAALY